MEGIDCCTQGFWFVEAYVPKCTLESLNYFDDFHNHASSYQSLLHDHPPPADDDGPLVLMQVTQYACGGFVMGLTFCHSICDGLGAAQFLQVVGEIAAAISTSRPRGGDVIVERLPSVVHVWHRGFLPMMKPTPVTATGHHEQQMPLPVNVIVPNNELQHANIDIPLC